MPGRETDSRVNRDPMPGANGAAGPSALTADEFATHFQGVARSLWAVAAGILGDRTEAEDVLQEACMMALTKLDQFERGSNFGAWMGRFVRFVALNQGRKDQRRATRPTDPGELLDVARAGVPAAWTGAAPGVAGAGAEHAPSELDPLAALNVRRLPVDEHGALLADAGHFDDELMRGLRELAPIARACLLLKTVVELDYREIAALLEIPEGTAMSHVHRSRGLLRERLGAQPRASCIDREKLA